MVLFFKNTIYTLIDIQQKWYTQQNLARHTVSKID